MQTLDLARVRRGVGRVREASNVWWKLMGNEAAHKALEFSVHGWEAPQAGAGCSDLPLPGNLGPPRDTALQPRVSIRLHSVQHVGKEAVYFKTFCL